MALLYAKTVTLGQTHWAESNEVMLRNRRIGCSMSGIAQFVTHYGECRPSRPLGIISAMNGYIWCSMAKIESSHLLDLPPQGVKRLQEWCDKGYAHVVATDKKISSEFAVPTSIKLTSVKPSGTVSLLAGATSGVHYPHSRFLCRRIRLPSDSELVHILKEKGYHTEQDVGRFT